MFGKCVKYEFKSTAKWYLLITLIALGLSVITGDVIGECYKRFCIWKPIVMQIIFGLLGFSFGESLVLS